SNRQPDQAPTCHHFCLHFRADFSGKFISNRRSNPAVPKESRKPFIINKIRSWHEAMPAKEMQKIGFLRTKSNNLYNYG
ncbi:hypothetical protein J0683_24895, partial [Vibrio parahaemolyticus]|uniref:hypothetical protein n=1 Tax=Vibrio parahaemolyticus TaxID=670 RepID=UPI001A8D746D|nr:hypothetical protein [Vibrio parahaemolyticus]